MQTTVITPNNRNLHEDLWLDHHRLRHEVFVKRLGWDVSSCNGLEFDGYDTEHTTYVVTADDLGRARAVSRLLPTTRPYMIRDLWPEWYHGPLPAEESVWEASRFACCATLTPAERNAAITQLLAAIYRHVQSEGVEDLLMVMPHFIFERIIKPRGYDVTYVGATRVMDSLKTCLGRVRVEPRPGLGIAPAQSGACQAGASGRLA